MGMAVGAQGSESLAEGNQGEEDFVEGQVAGRVVGALVKESSVSLEGLEGDGSVAVEVALVTEALVVVAGALVEEDLAALEGALVEEDLVVAV